MDQDENRGVSEEPLMEDAHNDDVERFLEGDQEVTEPCDERVEIVQEVAESSSADESIALNEGEAFSSTAIAEAAHEPKASESTSGAQVRYREFLQNLEQQPSLEDKLRAAIAFMEECLSQHGGPLFKNFWEARKLSLELFKENISSTARMTLWAKYRELSSEAKRLKEILDEQAAFAAEQIEGAIKAIEEEMESYADQLQKTAPLSLPSETLSSHKDQYDALQRELNLLNAFAARINALRKELIKTEMRISQKNKFFKRLSLLGDRTFPRRKDLIKEMSQRFCDDVDVFIKECEADAKASNSLFFYREEIKALQGMAKVLTLNTQSFTSTRMKLSGLWDQLKLLDKERKKEQTQKRQEFRQNEAVIQAKLEEFSKSFGEGHLSVNEANRQLDAIAESMRQSVLGRQEVQELREALSAHRSLVVNKVKEEEAARHKQEEDARRTRREAVEAYKAKLDDLLEQAEAMSVVDLAQARAALAEESTRLLASREEKMAVEQRLRKLSEVISEKKEQAMLMLSGSDREALTQLAELLEQRKAERKEIKELLETLRKAGRTSGLDFEKAMAQSQQATAEKERLEKVNKSIEEIEKKIALIGKNVS